jgi:hypothetical protein
MKNRAYRRHHAERMIRRAERLLGSWAKDKDWVNWSARRWADNLAKCSCESCGNPRRHFNEVTIQEQRAKIKDEE